MIYTSSTRAFVLGQVVGYSQRGDAHRRTTHKHGGKPVVHDCASIHCLSLPHVWSPLRPAHSQASSLARVEQLAAIRNGLSRARFMPF